MAAKLVRQVHERSLVDDPVRALRAVRMAVSLGFTITAETEKSIADTAVHFEKVSIERVRDELLKLLLTKAPDVVVQELARLGLLPTILPEIARLPGVEQSAPHYEDVFDHTCSVMRWLTLLENVVLDGKSAEDGVISEIDTGLTPFIPGLRAHFARPVTGDLNGRTLLRLGALFHDCGKRDTQTFEENGRIRFIRHDKVGAKMTAERLRKMRLSNEAIDHVKRIVAHHMRPLLLEREPRVSRRAIFRFFKATGSAGLDVALLSLADNLATYDGRDEDGRLSGLLVVMVELLSHYFQRYEETVKPPMLLDGNQLMKELGLAPGRQVGQLLGMIQEAQAAGEVTTREQAIEFAREYIKK
jgi:putative nucleotidyltransferase with HDIG domain